jgi:hypothetical protein
MKDRRSIATNNINSWGSLYRSTLEYWMFVAHWNWNRELKFIGTKIFIGIVVYHVETVI